MYRREIIDSQCPHRFIMSDIKGKRLIGRPLFYLNVRKGGRDLGRTEIFNTYYGVGSLVERLFDLSMGYCIDFAERLVTEIVGQVHHYEFTIRPDNFGRNNITPELISTLVELDENGWKV